MGLMDKVKAKLSSSSDNKRSSVIGSSSPAATSSAPATSSTTPAAATTTSAAATTTPAAATTTTPAPATTGAGEPPYPPATTQDNKSAEPATSTSNMSSYTGTCHCKHHEWTVELTPDQSKHILCHCDTCKILGGGAYTMNQIIPKSALKITKGGEPGKYTYYGDSGKAVNCYYCPKCTSHIYHHQEVMGPDTIIARTALLQEGRDKFPVGAEIYGKAKMSWEPKIAETFETLPPS